MEASTFETAGLVGFHGRVPLLRFQSDERLVALVRAGNTDAFEALVGRYRVRLLSFTRHMVKSQEDAEDLLQEVFTAAYNALLADDRPINVRPWLYRIARNRALNHLRRPRATSVDCLDEQLSEFGMTTADKAAVREEFRTLIADVQKLPENQRSALLLREIEALSYDQIAEVMDTTVSAVKSLLVRARVGLAEASETRAFSCEEARLEIGAVAEGLQKMQPVVKRHLKECDRCREFRKHMKHTSKGLAAIFPVGPLLLLKVLLFGKAGAAAGGSAGAAAGSAAVSGGAACTGGSVAGGILQACAGSVATKAAAGLAVATLATAGAVEVRHVTAKRPASHTAVAAQTYHSPKQAAASPQPTSSAAQPISETVSLESLGIRPMAMKRLEPDTPGATTVQAPVAAGPVLTSDLTRQAPPVTQPVAAAPIIADSPGSPAPQLKSEGTQQPTVDHVAIPVSINSAVDTAEKGATQIELSTPVPSHGISHRHASSEPRARHHPSAERRSRAPAPPLSDDRSDAEHPGATRPAVGAPVVEESIPQPPTTEQAPGRLSHSSSAPPLNGSSAAGPQHASPAIVGSSPQINAKGNDYLKAAERDHLAGRQSRSDESPSRGPSRDRSDQARRRESGQDQTPNPASKSDQEVQDPGSKGAQSLSPVSRPDPEHGQASSTVSGPGTDAVRPAELQLPTGTLPLHY